MRLLRLGEPGEERPHVLVNSQALDVGDLVRDFDGEFFAGEGFAKVARFAKEHARHSKLVNIGDSRVGAPIARPHQVLCVGLNYLEHARESDMQKPDEPMIFSKSPNTVVGPADSIVRPLGSTKLDYEVEIGVVMRRRSQYLRNAQQAENAIAGLVLVNDVSERAFQLERGGQWIKGKSAMSFNPCGPYLVTLDEIANLRAIEMWLEVNGERRQAASTADMIFGILEIVQYLSQYFVLEPGDLINTGTPAGVGLGMKPPKYLSPGDVVALGATGLGSHRSLVVDHSHELA